MRIRFGIYALAAIVALSTTPAGAAPITWDLSSGGCSTSGGSNDGNTRTCSGNQGGSPTVTASAWANTGGASNTLIQNALLESFSGGLGVRNRDRASGQGDTGENSSPEHAMDNDGRYDSIQFGFSSAIKVTGVEVGWWDDDSDITVLAHTGAGTPTLANNTYGSLLGAGWTLIGHYANVGDGASRSRPSRRRWRSSAPVCWVALPRSSGSSAPTIRSSPARTSRRATTT